MSIVISVLGAFQQLELTLELSAELFGTWFASLNRLTQELQVMSMLVMNDVATYRATLQRTRSEEIDGICSSLRQSSINVSSELEQVRVLLRSMFPCLPLLDIWKAQGTRRTLAPGTQHQADIPGASATRYQTSS